MYHDLFHTSTTNNFSKHRNKYIKQVNIMPANTKNVSTKGAGKGER